MTVSPPEKIDKSRFRLRTPELWIFFAAFSLRLVTLSRLWSSRFSPVDQSDMRFYHDWALRILHGQWTDHKAFIAMPGYSFFLAAIYRVAGVHPWAVAFLNALSESFIAVTIFYLARLVFRTEEDKRGDWIGVMAAAGWMFFIPAQTYSLVLMPTTYLILAYWLIVLWCVKVDCGQEGRSVPLWHFLLIGIAIGVMAMLVATILFVFPMVIAAALRESRRSRRMHRVRRSFAAIACAAAGIYAGTSPCWIHNYFIANDPVFLSAHGGLNFWIGNNPTSTGYPQVPPGLKASTRGMLVDSFAWPPRWLHRSMKRSEISQFWSERAKTFIREHPAQWIKILGMKVSKFWNRHEYDDLDILSNFRAGGVTLGFLTFGLVAIAGLPAIGEAIMESRRALWVVAAILLQMAALMPVFITERYRLAAVPGLIVLAAFACWWFCAAIRHRQWASLAGYLLFALATGWWVSSPQSETGVVALEEYNRGIQALAANDLIRADTHLRQAYETLPDNPDVNAAMGALALNRGDHEAAKKFLRRAIERDPKNLVAWQNLGGIALLESRPDIAVKFFERATIADPDDSNALILLAKAKEATGDLSGGLEAASKAVELDPDRPESKALKADLVRALRASGEK